MRTVPVLQVDAGLAEGLSAPDRSRAMREALALEVTVSRGPWRPLELLRGAPGDIGLLLLDGYVGRETRVLGRSTLELLGPGDVLRPWDLLGEDPGAVRVDMTWTALSPLRVAVLDHRFARSIGTWPPVIGELLARVARRSRWLALNAAAVAIPRLQERLLVLLWLAADRWGRVTPTGVLIPIRLTQAQLAAMAGARRPSVSTALTALGARGLVVREPRGAGWRLSHDAAAEIEGLALSGPASAALSLPAPSRAL